MAEVEREIGIHALRQKQPKLGVPTDSSFAGVLAHMISPREHRTPFASTKPLERMNRAIKRGADVTGLCPNDEAINRLLGVLTLETNHEWAVAERYLAPASLARVTDTFTVGLPAEAA